MIKKFLLMICMLLGAAFLIGRFDSAHNTAFTVGDFPFSWILVGSLAVGYVGWKSLGKH